MSKLTFLGGAGGVTGSKHLLTTDQSTVLLDCGTWQGRDANEKNRALPPQLADINAIVLSHAHLDHCGLIPRYHIHGFKGPIYSTPATRDIAEIMLNDAAKIQEQDKIYQEKHNLPVSEPLFTSADVPPALSLFNPIPYIRHAQTWETITPNIQLKFYDAGHIVGSAVSVLKIQTGQKTRLLAYTGDLGPPGLPLLHDPEIPEESIETLIMESTYGRRQHEPLDQALARLAAAVNQVCDRQGKIIAPAFSLGRTQTLVYLLHKLTDEGKIPRLPIYVDSPLATDITDIVQKDVSNFDQATWTDFNHPLSPLAFRNLTYTRSSEESKMLNVKPGPFLIIAGSGMMTAGRVVHHLRHSIADPRNAIFITGYQAESTLGRKILEGTEKVNLYGDMFPVRAEVFLFNEFSAHADADQLQAYAEKITGLKRVILVHGEAAQADVLKSKLQAAHPDWEVLRPNENESVDLSK